MDVVIHPSVKTAKPSVWPPGVRLGDFEQIGELGQGAMGTVYRARQVSLNRVVAVKVLTAGRLASDVEIKRFIGEAEKAGKLKHPNIISVHVRGQEGPIHYFAMDLVEGKNLAEILHGKPMAADRAARYLEVVARAMSAAHKEQILHRDLKPANILINRQDQPIVTDFGLARDTTEEHNTLTNEVLGTPSYMSPEQAFGGRDSIDGRSDIYSMGVILYELLTGIRPFVRKKDDAVGAVLQMIRDITPVRPGLLNKAIPRDLETICLKCMQKLPADRYQTADELADDLGRFRRVEPILARRISVVEHASRWCRKNPVLSGSFAIAAVALLAVSLLTMRLQTTSVEGLTNLLVTAEPQKVSRILEDLKRFGPAATDRLAGMLQTNLPAKEEARVRLGLLSSDAGQVGRLGDAMLKAEPPEFNLIRAELKPYQEQLIGTLWPVVADEKQPGEERFRAKCALALFDPENSRWVDILPRFATELLARPEGEGVLWLKPAKSFHRRLIGPLSTAFRGSNEAAKSAAVQLLVELADDRPEELAEVIVEADGPQFKLLLAKLQKANDNSLQRLQSLFKNPGLDEEGAVHIENGSTLEKGMKPIPASDSRRRCRAAIALLHLGDGAHVWKILAHQRFPQARTYLIHQLPLLGVDPKQLVDRLKAATSVQERRAIILCLGEYQPGALRDEIRDAAIRLLEPAYRDDPDPGIHAAIFWTLQAWAKADVLTKRTRQLPSMSKSDAAPPLSWCTNTLGNTLAIVPPAQFWMGVEPCAAAMAATDDTNPRHLRRISRAYAIGANEVTLKEFDEYRRENPELTDFKQTSSDPDKADPVLNVTWMEAVNYCRWLTVREGMKEADQCYKPTGEPYPDALLRRGYRLPTNAEWEYACRAGSETSRFYGDDASTLNKYAWTELNSDLRTRPVAHLKPNDFGLFDMLGNAPELCHDVHDSPRRNFEVKVYPTKAGTVLEDVGGEKFGPERTLRGGAFNRSALQCLSAATIPVENSAARTSGAGFRLARTVKVQETPPDQYDVSNLQTVGEISLASYSQLADRIKVLMDLADIRLTKANEDFLFAPLPHAKALANQRLSFLLQSNGSSILALGYMPFANDEQALEALRPFFPTQELTENAIYRFPGPVPWYFRSSGGIGFLADTRTQLEPAHLPDPKSLTIRPISNDASISLRLDEIVRVFGRPLKSVGVEQIILDGEELSAGFRISRELRKAILGMSFVARPGSTVGRFLEAWKPGPTRLDVLRDMDCAMKLALTVNLHPSMKKDLLVAVRQIRDDVPRPGDASLSALISGLPIDEATRGRLFDIATRIVESGLIDVAGVRNWGDRENFIIAAHVPGAIELEEILVNSLFQGRTLTPQTTPNGWRMYSIKQQSAVAFRDDAVVVLDGEIDAAQVAQILSGIKSSGSSATKAVSPLLYEVRYGKLTYDFENSSLAKYPKMRQLFAESLQDHDRMTVTVGPDAGRLAGTVEFEEGVLQLFGKAYHYFAQLTYGSPSERSDATRQPVPAGCASDHNAP